MKTAIIRWLAAAIALLIVPVALAAGERSANLVDVEWLKRNLGREGVLLIDASVSKLYATKHIPGAVSFDLYAYGAWHKTTPAQWEQRFQSRGIGPGRTVVIYDEGGGMMATWLFFELHYHGFPSSDLLILDGGLAKWEASGGAVTKEPTPAPAKGAFRVTDLREESRVRLAEFVSASGDPARHALVEALEPGHHYGGAKFFDRAGHVPNALLMPTADFYNPDKTFKSPEELRRMARYLGIDEGKVVHSHCGGGVAATVPFFALKFLAGHPQVKLYKESQMEWLRDPRGLPFWTYASPFLARDAKWVSSWGGPMMRMYGVSELSVVDVRPDAAYRQGHVPFAINVPADVFRSHLGDPAKLAAILGPAGVDPAHEAVIVSSGGLNESSALAFVLLEKIGQKKVSLLMDSVDDWALAGLTIATEPTVVGRPKSPQQMAVPPAAYDAPPRADVLVRDARATAGPFPKVFLASGPKLPEKSVDGKVIHVPYTQLVNRDGKPLPAHEIWNVLAKAGVPRYAEIVTISEEPGEAAVNYVVLKLMGFPDVKMLVL